MMIPVNKLIPYCQRMLDESWGYIWGTAGVKWTEAKQKAATDDMAIKYGSRWIGHMVTDCSGMMVYIWKQFGKDIDHGSNSIARKFVKTLGVVPKPGYAAFKWRDKDTEKWQDGYGDFYHIGIVAADGKTVYEAQSTENGVVTTPVSKWMYFAPFKDVEYSGNEVVIVPTNENIIATATVISNGKLNVRPNHSTAAAWTFRLSPGDVVDVDETYQGTNYLWAHIITADGKTGWCQANYLDMSTPAPAPVPDVPDGSWYVMIPCESRAVAESLLTLFSNATLAGSDGDP